MTRVTVNLPGREALTASSFCSPCVAQELQAQTAAVQKTYFNSDGSTELEARDTDARWEGILVYEGLATGDGRYIENEALRLEGVEMPIPLRWAPTDIGAHGGAVVVGLIETLTRKGGEIWGTGFVDRGSEYGAQAYDLLEKKMLKGVSVDLDEMEVELRVRKELLEPSEVEVEKEEVDENGYVTVVKLGADDEIMVITGAVVRAATLVDIPAFKGAYVSLIASGEASAATPAEGGLVAAAPVRPPAAWFQNPGMTEPTPITITEDGRIYGHAALWNTCHTGFKNACVTAPKSATNYAWFRTGALLTDDGSEIPVGKITMSTGHAGTGMSAAPASAHYDDTGVVAADVAAGEDKHGIWISGSLRSTLTDAQIRELRAAPMSGDWRSVGGNLEMVALLAVNLPGFPVPRTRALVASGRTTTLLLPADTGYAGAEVFSSKPQIEALIRRARLARITQEVRGV